MFYRRLSDLIQPLWPCHKWDNSVKPAWRYTLYKFSNRGSVIWRGVVYVLPVCNSGIGSMIFRHGCQYLLHDFRHEIFISITLVQLVLPIDCLPCREWRVKWFIMIGHATLIDNPNDSSYHSLHTQVYYRLSGENKPLDFALWMWVVNVWVRITCIMLNDITRQMHTWWCSVKRN